MCETAFPTGKRTYARLSGGDVTAGNAVIVPGSIVERLAEVFDTFYRARKNPVAMAKLLSTSLLDENTWPAASRCATPNAKWPNWWAATPAPCK